MTLKRIVSILAAETKYEFLKVVRMPGYTAPVLIFPLMFYVIFGLSFGGARATASSTVASYMLASMGAFGVIGAAMFGLGVSVAGERGQGWLTVKRASPMPMIAYLGAKMFVAMIFGAIIVACLFVLGAFFGHVSLSPGEWVSLGVSLVLGAIPFCAFGLAIGYLAGPTSAPPIVNLLYLPMAFASGLWMPLEILPRFVQRIAPFLPPFHLSQLALDVTGIKPRADIPMHFIALAAFTVIFLGLATVGYRRDEGRTYG
jgi:ABC-2 type transport system permease protein